jgi:uncharacterized protein YdeI (YjbR/CyaY-like superfamily)
MIAEQTTAAKVEPPTLAFGTATEFEEWVAAHRDDPAGLWLRIAKKGSGIESVSYAEALQIALCYGWIDGQSRGGDDSTYKQRFCPRRPRSVWSKRNVGYVTELTKAGRMQPEGIAEVERAKADGRWARAYDGPATATVPEDLRAALDADPAAARAFAGLSSAQRYTIFYQVQDAKRAETRARRIDRFVEMLAKGRTP